MEPHDPVEQAAVKRRRIGGFNDHCSEGVSGKPYKQDVTSSCLHSLQMNTVQLPGNSLCPPSADSFLHLGGHDLKIPGGDRSTYNTIGDSGQETGKNGHLSGNCVCFGMVS